MKTISVMRGLATRADGDSWAWKDGSEASELSSVPMLALCRAYPLTDDGLVEIPLADLATEGHLLPIYSRMKAGELQQRASSGQVRALRSLGKPAFPEHFALVDGQGSLDHPAAPHEHNRYDVAVVMTVAEWVRFTEATIAVAWDAGDFDAVESGVARSQSVVSATP